MSEAFSLKATPQAIIFDWDDTLFNGHALYHEVFVDMFEHFHEKYGIEPNGFTREEFDFNTHRVKRNALGEETFKSTRDFWIHTYGEEIGNEAMEYMQERLRDPDLNLAGKEMPQARELLTWLKAHHIPFAIASNSQQDVVEQYAKGTFGDLVKGVPIIGRNVESPDARTIMPKKPEPDMLYKALEQLGLPASENILMVGDQFSSDGISGLRAGLTPTIILHQAKPADAELAAQYNVDYSKTQYADTLADLFDALKQAKQQERFTIKK